MNQMVNEVCLCVQMSDNIFSFIHS